jgi:hypothetical protein
LDVSDIEYYNVCERCYNDLINFGPTSKYDSFSFSSGKDENVDDILKFITYVKSCGDLITLGDVHEKLPKSRYQKFDVILNVCTYGNVYPLFTVRDELPDYAQEDDPFNMFEKMTSLQGGPKYLLASASINEKNKQFFVDQGYIMPPPALLEPVLSYTVNGTRITSLKEGPVYVNDNFCNGCLPNKVTVIIGLSDNKIENISEIIYPYENFGDEFKQFKKTIHLDSNPIKSIEGIEKLGNISYLSIDLGHYCIELHDLVMRGIIKHVTLIGKVKMKNGTTTEQAIGIKQEYLDIVDPFDFQEKLLSIYGEFAEQALAGEK